jgi:inorganic pyrophosphatase
MDLNKLEIGAKAPNKINVVIETPKGSKAKYEIDGKGFLELDHVLPPKLTFPADYGFIPKTSWEDGDALDVFLISSLNNPPKSIIPARPVALLKMKDKGLSDDKVLAVPVQDPEFKNVKDLKDLPDTFIKELKHFIGNYKKGKVQFTGLYDIERALKAIRHGIKLYTIRQED